MKTQKIVLALALAAVTPAVLAAQENGNAYNKSTNEVIAPNTQTKLASITSFGPEGKILTLADNTLAKIRQNHKDKNQNKKQEKQKPAQVEKNDTTPAYYPYAGREGHMMALENLGKKGNKSQNKNKNQKNTSATPRVNKTTNNYNPYVGPEGHRMATGNYVRDAKQDTTPVSNTVKDIDTIARNHQATLDVKKADKSAKKTNSTFRQYLNEIGHAIAQEAPYMK